MEAISKFFLKMAVKKKMNDMGVGGGDKDGGIFGGGGYVLVYAILARRERRAYLQVM